MFDMFLVLIHIRVSVHVRSVLYDESIVKMKNYTCLCHHYIIIIVFAEWLLLFFFLTLFRFFFL